MKNAIEKPREELSQYAPRVITMHIDPEKIRDVIGSGGKVIQKIVADTGVKIDIEDDGTVSILSTDEGSAQEAVKIINGIVKEPEVGEVYMGKVVESWISAHLLSSYPAKTDLSTFQSLITSV